MEHVCEPNRPGGVFCECGKVVDRAGLRQIRFAGFTGPASLVPSVEEFWHEGDPSVFEKRT